MCTENLNPDVVVMQFAKDGMLFDASGRLNWARNRCILVQRPMRSEAVVIVRIGFQDPAQMGLAQDNHMIHAFAADRPDQPFGKPFCQGEAGGVGLSRMPMARNRRVTTAP